jgi:glucosamine-phosphate N-acetyltransferase
MALFSPSLISPEVVKAMPAGYIVRPLEANDYDKGIEKIHRHLLCHFALPMRHI